MNEKELREKVPEIYTEIDERNKTVQDLYDGVKYSLEKYGYEKTKQELFEGFMLDANYNEEQSNIGAQNLIRIAKKVGKMPLDRGK